MMGNVCMQRVFPSPHRKMCFMLVAHKINPEHLQTLLDIGTNV